MHTKNNRGSVLLETMAFLILWAILLQTSSQAFEAYRARQKEIRRERNQLIRRIRPLPQYKTKAQYRRHTSTHRSLYHHNLDA